MGTKSRLGYRGEDGQFISKKEAERLPKTEYTREHIPHPGRGDTKDNDKK